MALTEINMNGYINTIYRSWYYIIYSNLNELSDKMESIEYYYKKNVTAYLMPAIDDVLYMSKNEELLTQLFDRFCDVF